MIRISLFRKHDIKNEDEETLRRWHFLILCVRLISAKDLSTEHCTGCRDTVVRKLCVDSVFLRLTIYEEKKSIQPEKSTTK